MEQHIRGSTTPHGPWPMAHGITLVHCASICPRQARSVVTQGQPLRRVYWQYTRTTDYGKRA